MDDGFLGHHKTRRAIGVGAEALVMWCALRTYVGKHLTDGFIADEEIDNLPDAPKHPRKWLKVLVDCGKPERDGTRGAGLVDHCDGGWVLHNYLKHALTSEEIRRRKDFAKERKRLQRLRETQRQAASLSAQKAELEPPVTLPVTLPVTRDISKSHKTVTRDGRDPIPSHDLDLTENKIQRPASSERPKPVDNFARSFETPSTEAKTLFDVWQLHSGKTGVKFDWNIRLTFEEAAHAGVTPEDMRQIVLGAKRDKWAVQEARLMPSALLKNSESRAKYIDMFRNPPTSGKAPEAPKPPQSKGLAEVEAERLAALAERDRAPSRPQRRPPVAPPTPETRPGASSAVSVVLKSPTEKPALDLNAARNKALSALAQFDEEAPHA